MLQKNMLTYLLVLVLHVCAFCNPSASSDPPFKIAILPFAFFMDTNNLPGDVNETNAIKISETNRYRFQRAVHTWFIKKNPQYALLFQDVLTTNILLKKSGLIDSINISGAKKLCEVLGVDALIFGNTSVASHQETGRPEGKKNIFRSNSGTITKTSVDLKLYNSSGNIEWSKAYDEVKTILPDEIVDKFFKKEYKAFPYKK